MAKNLSFIDRFSSRFNKIKMHDSPMPKATIVVWTDFTEVHIKQLDESIDAESMNKIFLKIFQWEPNKKRTIVLCDLFYYAFVFARNNKFNPEQISTFLSIIKRVHDACIRTPFANMQETYQFFKLLVLKHSLSRPPQNLRIFTPDVTKKVTDYIVDTYFRHYKMYKYLFTPTIDFHLNFHFDGMIEKKEEKQEETIQIEVDEEKQKEIQLNAENAEIRRMIHGFIHDEMIKVKTTNSTEKVEPVRSLTEKQRPVKSSSTKTSKSRTPK